MLEHLFGVSLYILLLAVIGWVGWRRVRNESDYILGGRRLGWFVVALSAGATGMSGWLMLGLPGEAYKTGAGVIWLVLGLALGIVANWTLVAKRLRIQSELLGNSLTLPTFLAAKAGGTKNDHWLDTPALVKRISGISILIFLGLYTATGLVAGGKLFEQVFGLHYQLGVSLTALLVVLYSLMGGFLSISWSDVLQAILMISILILTAVLVSTGFGLAVEPGGAPLPEAFYSPLNMPGGAGIGIVAIISGLSWGLGYFGQPHILARFKAMRNSEDQRKAFPLGASWSIISMLAAIVIGFSAREHLQLSDPETALLNFITLLYHPLIGGIALAAVLAAIMSTSDSQLLVATTAFTRDLANLPENPKLLVNRIVMLVIALAATLLAFNPNATIFGLVSYAWAGLGASFGPSVILGLYWSKLTGLGMLLSIITGTLMVFLWNAIPIASDSGLYVLAPAFACSLVVAVATSLIQERMATS